MENNKMNVEIENFKLNVDSKTNESTSEVKLDGVTLSDPNLVRKPVNKKSMLSELEDKIDKLQQVVYDLEGIVEPSDEFVTEFEKYVISLYKKTIAIICGIDVEQVTDEMVNIARDSRVPVGGQNVGEDGSVMLVDGERPLNDDELKERLKGMYVVKDPDHIAVLLKKEHDIFSELTSKNMSELVIDNFKKMFNDLYRKTIAEIAGCGVEHVTDEVIEFIKEGHVISFLDPVTNEMTEQVRHFSDLEVAEIVKNYLMNGVLEAPYITDQKVQIPQNIEDISNINTFKM